MTHCGFDPAGDQRNQRRGCGKDRQGRLLDQRQKKRREQSDRRDQTECHREARYPSGRTTNGRTASDPKVPLDLSNHHGDIVRTSAKIR